MRCTWLIWAGCAISAPAQTTWQWTQAFAGRQPFVTDAAYSDNRVHLAVVAFQGLAGDVPGRSELITLEQSGAYLGSIAVLPDADGVLASFVGSKQSGLPTYLSGACQIGLEYGFFAYTISGNGVLSAPSIRIFPGYQFSSSESSLPLANGGLIISGSLRDGAGSVNRIALVQIGIDGSIEQDVVYGQGNGLTICRKVVEWNGSTYVTVEGRLPEFNESGLMRGYRLDSELGVVQSFLLPRFDMDPEPPIDSIPGDVLDLVPISQTRFASSGRFGSIIPPMARAAISIADTTGALIRGWLPRSSYPMDFTPFLQPGLCS
jgi:hypothetical protein